jgi:hypothetical protein
MNKRFKLLSALAYAVAISMGVFTLASQARADPTEPAPKPYWHCEYCRCQFPSGICECTNCTFY